MTFATLRDNRFLETSILVMMLEMLHLSIWLDFGSVISRSIMLSHLGLFLLWQPVWRGDKKLGISNSIIFIVFTSAMTIWLNLWVLFIWLILLAGFISGRINLDRREQSIHIIALAFVVLELLFVCVPRLAHAAIEFESTINIILLLTPLMILSFARKQKNYFEFSHTVDLIHALTTSMFTSLFALGILLNMFLSKSSYFAALTQTSLVIGGFIICISWLLTTNKYFESIGQLWSSYMLNIGTPFEEWLSDLSKINDEESSAEMFLHEAMHRVLLFKWVAGVKWSVLDNEYKLGDSRTEHIEIQEGKLDVTIFTFNKPGVALKLHSQLLIKLLNNFYQNKVRQEELTEQAHLRAIYETGARITHDIKNMLQSLHAITSLVETDNIQQTQAVMRRQLPNITHRLQMALDKLQTPLSRQEDQIDLRLWWESLKKRHEHNQIHFADNIIKQREIPTELFDSVIDNLIENALSKRMTTTALRINVELESTEEMLTLKITDDGEKIPQSISRNLLKTSVESEDGLGIGLYQANKLAEMYGYKLKLLNNENNNVCFALSIH